ncbi:hypothetical protein AMAG_19350 [Allomyces macrogynus ATCC 38327]|uniref:RecQ-mediated genome instability protein 1 n=1 Tax=Allomyces macrogynus (strain ATCC 38327) TaxID=578462 RepID=A0A0L0SUK2_ALLM3|nr:hypothetical protein AMAG_19350 [Allomyces macrogynus ATCC 38327]|eukprot:KNE66146.1 hypothetical protein AMAG_19350 [Allomyces macrogynus ATCC 38327]
MSHAAAAGNHDPALPAVLNALRARGIHVHPEWPAQCLKFVRASTDPPPSHQYDLERLVLDQYLLADLRHVAVPALPPHAASFDHTNMVIRDAVLQIMAIDEVGASTLRVVDALEALLAFNKATANEQPPPPPPPIAGGRGGGRARVRAVAPTIPRTMLKLYLTDGHTDLVGMEYQPMPFLSLLMPLGAKIRVQNARCSRGVLFLTPETTQLLGGEVEELKVTLPDQIARLKARIGLREHPNAARAPPGPVDRMANQFLIAPPDMADAEDPDEAPLPIASLADAQADDNDGPPPLPWPGALPPAPPPQSLPAWPTAPPPPLPPPPRQPPVPPRPSPPRPALPPPQHAPTWPPAGDAPAPAPPRPPIPAAPQLPRPDPSLPWPSSDSSDPLPLPPDPPPTVPTGPTGRTVLRPRAVAPRTSSAVSSGTSSMRGSAESVLTTPPTSNAANPVAVPARVKRESIDDARRPPVKRSRLEPALTPPTSSLSAPTAAPSQAAVAPLPERVAFRCTAIGQTGMHIRPNPSNKKQVQAIIPLQAAPAGEVLYAIANEPLLGNFVDLDAWRATRDQAHFTPLKKGLVPALVGHTVYLTRGPDPGGVAFQTKALKGRAKWELAMTQPAAISRRVSRLPDHEAQHLRSAVIISSLTDLVLELVYNAIDAGATRVAVKMDLVAFQVTIKDDGAGCHPDDMDKIFLRHYSSKGANQAGETYGFRGEDRRPPT